MKPTMSCCVACIIAWFAVLIVLNSPAPISAVQLRANLQRVTQPEGIYANRNKSRRLLQEQTVWQRT